MRFRRTPTWYRSRWVRAYLQMLALSTGPIVVGPFRSELGFEVLYWQPFIAWVMKTYKINPERLLVVSRGGMGQFYGQGVQSKDLYSLRTVDQVRMENVLDQQTVGIQKQLVITDWDREVARDAMEGKRAHLLHPSLMYWLFETWWEDETTADHVARHTHYQPLPMVQVPENFGLPKEYIAVRFYERFTFPLNPETEQAVQDMVGGLAAKIPVVLLNQKIYADDHVDFPLKGENVFTLPEATDDTNFIAQAAVLQRAQAFVGTYGGVSQFALRYGKPSLSFYTQFGGTAHAHLTLSQRLARGIGVPFETVDLRAAALYKATVGGLTMIEPRRVSSVVGSPPKPNTVAVTA